MLETNICFTMFKQYGCNARVDTALFDCDWSVYCDGQYSCNARLETVPLTVTGGE